MAAEAVRLAASVGAEAAAGKPFGRVYIDIYCVNRRGVSVLYPQVNLHACVGKFAQWGQP